MPNTPRALTNLLEGLKEFRTVKKRLTPGLIYAATAVVMVIAILMITVVSSIKHADWQQTSNKSSPVKVVAVAPETMSSSPPSAESTTGNSQLDKSGENRVVTNPQQGANYSLGNPSLPAVGIVKQDFGWQLHPVYHDWRYNNGVDIVAAVGTPVNAMYGGQVTSVLKDKEYGLTVAVQSGEEIVYYGDLAAVSVDSGKTLAAGDKIGVVGSSGAEPYIHLHLAIKEKDHYIDPSTVLGTCH